MHRNPFTLDRPTLRAGILSGYYTKMSGTLVVAVGSGTAWRRGRPDA